MFKANQESWNQRTLIHKTSSFYDVDGFLKGREVLTEIELNEMPDEELNILAGLYERRGLKKETALQVAIELTEKDALAAHIRDELGINEISQAKPIQAAIASGASFTIGGILPLLVVLFAPVELMEYCLYGFTIIFLIVLGTISAKTGGSNVKDAIIRITIWGTLAMGLSAFVGYLFGVKV
jgi:VIT1/CCC1 family predicted Fe2+/Mn2+ transporter